MSDKSGPQEAVEDVKGKAKEVAGAVTGRDDLRREGNANEAREKAEQ